MSYISDCLELAYHKKGCKEIAYNKKSVASKYAFSHIELSHSVKKSHCNLSQVSRKQWKSQTTVTKE